MGYPSHGHGLDCGSTLDIMGYDLFVDVTGGGDTFASRVEIRFSCGRPRNSAFADLQAVSVRRAELNGTVLQLATAYQSGRLELHGLAAENTLIVEAEFSYASVAAGLHRQAGPDGSGCVYSKAYPGGAPRMYCCFDQANLRAPFMVSIKAPAGWTCIANGPVVSRPAVGGAGLWKFATTKPIAPYLTSFCAGPFSGPAFVWAGSRNGSVPVTANALPPAAAALDAAVSPEWFLQPLAYYERNLGTPYPYGKCDLVFVPGFPGLAFGAPGLVTVKEQALTEPPNDRHVLYLAAVIAHELAHAWLGGLITFQPPGDGWLEEAITTYISRAALEDAHPSATPWEPTASSTLPDRGYASKAAIIRQLDRLIGRQAVFAGLRSLLQKHAHGHISKDDLVQSWSRTAGRDLRGWAAQTLMPPPADAAEGTS